MPIHINTNVRTIGIQRQIGKSQNIIKTALERLSSGKRVNRAGDDAAGLAIAQALTAQLRGMDQAARNAYDGVSLIQTADGVTGTATDIVQRMRELTVQAASDLNSPQSRQAIQSEIDQLSSELDRITTTTSFNGKNLFDGSFTNQALQVGPGAGDTVSLTIDNLSAAALGVDGLDVSSNASAGAALTALDGALGTIAQTRSRLGAVENRLHSTIDTLDISRENVAASRSRILDADFALEVSNRIRGDILLRTGIAALSQANISARAALNLLGS